MPRKQIIDPKRRTHHVEPTVEANSGLQYSRLARLESHAIRGRRPPSRTSRTAGSKGEHVLTKEKSRPGRQGGTTPSHLIAQL